MRGMKTINKKISEQGAIYMQKKWNLEGKEDKFVMLAINTSAHRQVEY